MSGDSSTKELDPHVQQEKERRHELYREYGLLFEQLATPFSPHDLYMLSSRVNECAQLLSLLDNMLDARKAQSAGLADGPHADAMQEFQNGIEQVRSKVKELAGNLPQRQAEIDARIKEWDELGYWDDQGSCGDSDYIRRRREEIRQRRASRKTRK
ncbi:MAG: hypothetical protein Q9181_006803 [Wetmoreana brouardii]